MLARFSTYLAEWYSMGSAVQTMFISSHYGRDNTRTRIDIEQGMFFPLKNIRAFIQYSLL